MNPINIIQNLISILSILAAGYLWLNSHNLKFYLWVQRIRHKLLPSKSVTWEVGARWEGIGNENILDDLGDRIIKFYDNNVLVTETNGRKRNYLIENRFNLETLYEVLEIKDEGYHFALQLRIYTLTVNFAESKEVLERDVMSIIDIISSRINRANSKEDYNITMTFSENVNPFLGLCIQQLHPKEIKNLHFTIAPKSYDIKGKSLVDITPNKLSITAHSPRVLQVMTVDFLSFAPRLSKSSAVS